LCMLCTFDAASPFYARAYGGDNYSFASWARRLYRNVTDKWQNGERVILGIPCGSVNDLSSYGNSAWLWKKFLQVYKFVILDNVVILGGSRLAND
jgi:hypothetical protein